VGLIDAQGNRWGWSDAAPIAGYLPWKSVSPGAAYRDAHALTVLPGTPPGRYRIEISWFSRAENRALDVRDAAGNPQGTTVTIGEVDVARSPHPVDPTGLDIPNRQQIDAGSVRLLGYDRPAGVFSAGEAIPLTLFWQKRQAGDAPLSLALKLVQGERAWQRRGTQPISPTYPPGDWQADEVVRQQWPALLPSQAPAGRYDLVLVLTTGEGDAAIEVPLGAVEMAARPHWFDLPAPQFPSSAILGSPESVRLLGYDIAPPTARAGDTLNITLHWQALQEMDTSYKIFIHVLDAQGAIRAQKDSLPLEGQAVTTSWVPGEGLADRYQITLPPDIAPGRYTLHVGLYDAISGQRLPVAGGGGLDSIELRPGPEVIP
jgi:hypothetical protein